MIIDCVVLVACNRAPLFKLFAANFRVHIFLKCGFLVLVQYETKNVSCKIALLLVYITSVELLL